MKGDTEGSDRRTFPRRSIIWQGELTAGGYSFSCSVWNLSLVGARIRLDLPLKQGAPVVLTLPQSGPLDAKIMWQRGTTLGIGFDLAPQEVRALFSEELIGRLGLDAPQPAGED